MPLSNVGALNIPVPVPASNVTAGDPALDILGDFVKTVVNAYGATAWASITPASQLPIKKVHVQDLKEVGFNIQDLPALYLHRADWSAPERIADEWQKQRSVITAHWVLPYEADQLRRKRRGTFAHAMRACIVGAIEAGRDPNWKVVGDPDTNTPALGSLLAKYLKFHTLEVGRMQFTRVATTTTSGESYMPAALFTFDIEEDAPLSYSPYQAFQGIDGSMKSSTGSPKLTYVSGQFRADDD
jgi:hypothetical protein